VSINPLRHKWPSPPEGGMDVEEVLYLKRRKEKNPAHIPPLRGGVEKHALKF